MRTPGTIRQQRIAMRTCHVASGLTVVEVLFAMVIILVGLIGVAAMIPFAARQAEESYKTTQGLATGESALAVFNSSSIVRPRFDSPWLHISDQGTRSNIGSLKEFYFFEYKAKSTPPFTTPSTPLEIARLQNKVIGTGVCIDPLFWGYQTTPAGAGNFAKTRFPFFNEAMPADYDPFNTSGPMFSTPRLRRLSLLDPSAPLTAPRWLRLPTAIQLVTLNGGDLIQAQAEQDKSAPPMRGEYFDNQGALIQSPTSGASVSWLATLTPSDDTPVIAPEMLAGAPATAPALVPENYNLGVVVFSKRDVRDFDLNPTTGIQATLVPPVSERIGFVKDTGTSLSWNAGSFDILIEADAQVDSLGTPLLDPRIKVGDWLMLSRSTFVEMETIPPSASFAAGTYAERQRHKWYRVIGVSSEQTFPREVRVTGEPWYWTRHELRTFSKYGITTLPTMPVTAVTMLKNVVHVYERTVNLDMN